ncbi:MAG: hypothetical protein IIY52_04250 [Solobacterium sp.]|nr:hypothetical protein [Erysipelotrichaceae bacterium]MBQ1325209.1 hypothetical protein [Solobacterium sp.]MBQ1382984.1 hypothetical protein [Solobacterium sp.]MBQ1446355.1 hypothetical protein [Solobacterium sp.]MBQ2688863.1 hypothetical protein [Solobacterium sp.]
MTVSRIDENRNLSIHTREIRAEIDTLLQQVTTLNEEEKKRLRECYVQRNTVYSTAVKLNRSEREISLWYFYISSALARNALKDLV